MSSKWNTLFVLEFLENMSSPDTPLSIPEEPEKQPLPVIKKGKSCSILREFYLEGLFVPNNLMTNEPSYIPIPLFLHRIKC